MAGENYDSTIEDNAAHYGYKAANLIYLNEVIKEFEASVEARELHRLYGDITASVPAFQGVDKKIIAMHLDKHAANWKSLFENFQNHFNEQSDKNILSEPAKKSLKELQQVIIECFAKHEISEELFNEFLNSNNIQPNDLVMVRSTGIHEDKADMANPGGNESLPCHANIAEISAALGRVAASYIGEKSLSQRLGAGDTSITEFPVMPGLVQRLIGEGLSSKEVYSGVIYTNDGSTRMQAAPGHGEYVVNSKGRVDNYYVSPEGILYSEVRPKDFRLQPKMIPGSNKVSLERVENRAELKYGSALDEKTALYLNELGKFIEKKYGKRMDMEFVYNPQDNKINIVQARAIPEGLRKGLEPSAISPDFLGKNKSQLNIVDGLQVITPDVNSAAVVTNANQVIICNSIEEALTRYNTKGKDAGIIGVIVQNPSPDTSHEAGVFNSAGIRVMQVKDIAAFEKLLESKQPVIIDPQHSKIYQISQELFNAEEKTPAKIEQALYEEQILANGIYASPLTSYVTTVKHEFTAQGINEVPILTEGVLQDKTLGKLLAEAKAGNTLATEQLLSIAYEAMSFKLTQNNNENILDKAEKLRANLDILTAPKIGQSNDELKAALGNNLRLIAEARTKNIISEDLFKQTIILGSEVSIMLDKMSKLEGVSKQEQDKTYLEYFNSEKKFFGLMVGEGNSLATSLKAKQYEILAETLNPEIKGDEKIYLVESLKLRDYLISDEQKQNWDKFCASICTNPENAAVLGSIVNKAVSFNAHEQWINYIFADINDPANPKATLAKLVKDFNAVDLNKIQNATKLIKSMESQIPEWSDPAKFPKLYKELQDNVTTINENLKWSKDATNLEKVLILEQLNHITDILDKSTKSLERSSQYPESMKDEKGNDLQVSRFKDMIFVFHNHMKTCLPNGNFPSGSKARAVSTVKIELEKKWGGLNKEECNLSSDFSVSRASINFLGTERSRPKTLEDIFTLIHQDTVLVINSLNQNIASGINQQYPDLVNLLEQSFSSKIQKENKTIIEGITTTNEIKYPILKVIKNIPLRGHANIVEIKYNIKDKSTSVNFSLFGENDGARNRLEYITMNNAIELKLADFSIISPPYLDKQKGIVNFEVKIDNAQQIDKLIDIINKSIKISYDIGKGTPDLNQGITDWLDDQVKLLDELGKKNPELQKEIDNLKLLPNMDFTYKELQQYNTSKSKEFFIKYANTIHPDFSLIQAPLIDLYNKDNHLGELLANNISKNKYDIGGVSIDGVKNHVKLLDEINTQKPELKKVLDNFTLFPNADFSYKDLQQQNPKGKEFFMENIPAIQKFSKVGLTPTQLMELYNKDNDLGKALGEAIMAKNSTKFVQAILFKNLQFEDLKKYKAEDIRAIFSGQQNLPSPIGEWTTTPDDAKFFVQKAEFIKNLSDLGLSGKALKEIYDKSPDDAKFFVNKNKFIEKLFNVGITGKELKEIYDENPNDAKLFIKDSVSVDNLSKLGFSAPLLIEMYNKDNEAVKTLFNNITKITSVLKSKELTPEDLKKCKAEDIVDLANKKISAEQLKVNLATRDIFSGPQKPPSTIGEWTTKIQEKRQALKEDKATQR